LGNRKYNLLIFRPSGYKYNVGIRTGQLIRQCKYSVQVHIVALDTVHQWERTYNTQHVHKPSAVVCVSVLELYRFQLRAYIYQARNLLAGDSTGYSGMAIDY